MAGGGIITSVRPGETPNAWSIWLCSDDRRSCVASIWSVIAVSAASLSPGLSCPVSLSIVARSAAIIALSASMVAGDAGAPATAGACAASTPSRAPRTASRTASRTAFCTSVRAASFPWASMAERAVMSVS